MIRCAREQAVGIAATNCDIGLHVSRSRNLMQPEGMSTLCKMAFNHGARRATWVLACRLAHLFRSTGFVSLNVLAAAAPLAMFSAVVDAQDQISTRTKRAVPEVRVDSQTIRLPVIDGNDIRFRRLFTATGLSQTKVSQIVQDNRGFMWFGTQYGLNRYDGYQFKVFKHDPGHTESLSGVYIYSLFKDRSGSLWIGTDQSLDRFDPSTETVAHSHYCLFVDI